VKITPNFDAGEFACRDGTAYPEAWHEERLVPLCKTLQVIRDHIGRPLVIISGYRTAEYQYKLGGVPKSQHIQGRAADVRVGGMPASELHAAIMLLYGQGALPHLGGLGRYDAKNFVHVDVRPRKPDGSIARWSGKGVDY
jgi:uncharacterized protein YcbK (DUF882 family)